MHTETITIGMRLDALLEVDPDRTVLITVAADGEERAVTRRELAQRTRVAQYGLEERGVVPGALVVVALPSGADHAAVTLGAWRLGAVVLPLEPDARHGAGAPLPAERSAVTVTVAPAAGAVPVATLLAADVPASYRGDDVGVEGGALPRSAHSTGGTTGRPRYLLRRRPWVYARDPAPNPDERATGVGLRENELILLPLHHSGFARLYHGLALDHRVVLMERFVPALAFDLIARHRITYFETVPACMAMMLDAAGPDVDVSSVRVVHHSAARVPEPVKRGWLDLFGPEVVWEAYAMQERLGSVWIRGDEWLEHPGSVGRPLDTEARILDPDGREVAPGEIGEIFLRGPSTRQPRDVLGTDVGLRSRDGMLSVGDLGYLDAEGYLYIRGRRTEMIDVGGVNVFPAEVEDLLHTHDDVADVMVLGRPNAYVGQVVHAVVVPADPSSPPSTSALLGFCRRHLAEERVPFSVELATAIPRDAAGKVRHDAVAAGAGNGPGRLSASRPTPAAPRP